MGMLNSIVDLWLRQIRHAEKVKFRQFGKTAERAWRFLGKDNKGVYDDDDDYQFLKQPQHRTRRNLTAEYRSLMLPYVHHKVPTRLVTPSRPRIPAALLGMPPGVPAPDSPVQQQDNVRAWLMNWFLNWSPSQYDLRGEGRKSTIEALIKGRGIVWHEMFHTPYGAIPGSFYDSVDGLLIDPDCEHSLRDAGWIARKRRRSVWQVAEEFGIPPDDLRGAYTSYLQKSSDEAQGDTATDAENDAADDEASSEAKGRGDIVEYWEIYTRGVGLGHVYDTASDELKEVATAADQLGQNLYLAICPGLPWPMNLSPALLASDDIAARITAALQWPIPFFMQSENPWPMTPLDFYPGTDCPWPSSPLEPAIPLQVFLDLAYGFLMGRVGVTSRTMIVTSDAIEATFDEAIEDGPDLAMVTIKGNVQKVIKDMFAVVQFPNVNTDLYTIIQMVEQAFRMAMGTDSLLYGGEGATQIRSSAEVQIRQGNLMSRPEDMAECAERWQSDIARAEGFMARVAVAPQTVAPLLGEEMTAMGPMGQPQMGRLTQTWAMLVNADPARASMELAYTIEAGSGRRKNKQKQQADVQMLNQTIFPALLGYAQATGNSEPINALIEFIGEAFEIDLSKMQIPIMMPSPTAPGTQGPPPARAAAPANQGV
ncbi:hypothetical protein LCGC14_1705520 [marine sediment metagenome]|uniref:Portal protein n=1 Tax=marine sediment metagenome TaxID=412755 RepID=A0A0F9JX50_9ZZZZ|nr:hypothetical protein [Phycisphaerae bacterium]